MSVHGSQLDRSPSCWRWFQRPRDRDTATRLSITVAPASLPKAMRTAGDRSSRVATRRRVDRLWPWARGDAGRPVVTAGEKDSSTRQGIRLSIALIARLSPATAPLRAARHHWRSGSRPSLQRAGSPWFSRTCAKDSKPKPLTHGGTPHAQLPTLRSPRLRPRAQD